ncbi:MAG: hypothetical protein IT454_13120 [Planctomycetes bacterium]|nr:hypothetical protein [Planctomycetota bacterium]
MRKLLMLTVLLAGVALVAYVLTRRPPAPDESATPSEDRRAAPELGQDGLTPVASQPSSTPQPQHAEGVAERTLAPEARPEVREPAALEEGHAPVQPAGDFSAQYAALAPEKLQARLRELDAQVDSRVSELASARFEAGLFESHAPTDSPFEPPAEDATRWVRTRVSTDPANPGQVRFDVTAIPTAEHPELAQLAAERDWLRRFLAPGSQK